MQWKVERLIGVFLCAWTYPVFQAAKEGNRRVEEAFCGLEGALKVATQQLEARKKKWAKKYKKKRRKGEKEIGAKGAKGKSSP